MGKNKLQKNNQKGPALSLSTVSLSNLSKGFTLVETMVAVFILTIVLTSLLTLVSQSIFSARYARNEITANYLMQEAVDYVRNQRDTIAFGGKTETEGESWNNFLEKFGGQDGPCFENDGCSFDVNVEEDDDFEVISCDKNPIFGNLKCPILYYEKDALKNSFYNYNKQKGVPSNFKRKINLELNNNQEELYITVTIEWLNGKLVRTRYLYESLLNWY